MAQKEQIETGLEIAVIGMTGRFPGSKNIHEFWDNIKNGVESIHFFTDDELKESGVSLSLLENPNYVKANGMLEDFEYFDTSFFGYTPKEAEIMDPQIRIFHECAWAALENAGIAPGTYDGLIGLYAGASPNIHWQARTLLSGKSSEIGDFAANQLSHKDYITLRISYKLDLKGPSFVLYTACSTSLVAIHLACQAILNGECDMALAGGITVINLDKTGYMYQEGMVASPDGHCRAFDAKAKGVVGGDGVGIVVLKRLEDAVADRNHIYAMVKGSAVNNDGIRRAGFTAPSVAGQAEVIKMAMQVAEVEPESISYIETHGTGTILGDPVEIEGLKLAFNTQKKGFCGIGSAKTNVGHLDSAAGVAGFIKTVLALKHKLLPPMLHFENPNPGIDFIDSPFYLNTKLTPWENGEYPLRAGVSAFGIGGTNAHVILEAWGETLDSAEEEKAGAYQLIVLSARTATALDKMSENLANYFKKNPGTHLADAAYTLQVGRPSFKYRKMFICSSIEQASKLLSGVGPGEDHRGVIEEENMPPSVSSIESLDRLEKLIKDDRLGDPELHSQLEKIGFSWLRGETVDWRKLYPSQERRRIPLPTYPFEGGRYWIDEAHHKIILPGGRNAYKPISPKVTLYPRPELSVAYIPPTNETEKKLAGSWQSFFGFEKIGIQDDFFELGGDSLSIITMVSRIQKEMEILVPITEFFNRPNIGALAAYILDNPQKSRYVSIAPVEEREYYPMALAQRRLYILQQLDPGNISYNIPFVYHLDVKADIRQFREIFKKMLRRQESLRTSFHIVDGNPVQRIHREADLDIAIECYETAGKLGKAENDIEEIIKNFIRPFDLSQAPLMRVGLIKIAEGKNLLMTDMHHLISDGISMMITIRDFLLLYRGEELPGLPVQYKDYSVWQVSEKEKGALKKQEEYWLKEFNGDIPGLQLPLDYARPPVQSFEGGLVNFEIDAAQVQSLKILAESEGATLFMVLLAVYNVLLSRLSGQEQIVVGTGVAGRNHEEFLNLVGTFINTTPLKNYPAKEKNFRSFLKETKEKSISAFANQDYPFEELVEKVAPNRPRNRNPLFDVFLMSLVMDSTLLETDSAAPVIPAVATSQPAAAQSSLKYKFKHRVAKFDIGLLYTETAGKLEMEFEYCTKLFKRETIERFVAFFKDIVSAVITDKNITLGEIAISHSLLAAKEDVMPDETGDFRF